MTGDLRQICLVGYGEVGQMLHEDLPQTCDFVAWDTRFPVGGSGPARVATARGLTLTAGAAAAVRSADLVISAVTAEEALEAVQAVLPGLKPGAWYLDLNSCAPATKIAAAELVLAAGGHYVEGAVMAPVGPRRLGTAMLLGGPDAAAFLPVAKALGFTGAEVFSDHYGKASAAKMCRSIMVKGLEALVLEALLSARHYGVEDKVLSSLDNLLADRDWPNLSQYMISRALQHGRRRAEEMREVAKTVADAGVRPRMSGATAESQDAAAAFAAALDADGLDDMLDRILLMARKGTQGE
ncbi:MAG: NAD(P)-dependent oxidoreductase [Alphaproteobacteria bacterium]|nr:MAG: NAD(P)-dependent oxidoreductase [Alphaproteobacteria bacterium]